MPELPQRPRLELADSLPRDPELEANLLQRPPARSVEPVAKHEHALEAWLQLRQRPRELRRPKPQVGLGFRAGRVDVLDQVAHHALAVADGCLEAHVVLDEVEELGDPERREIGLGGDLLERGIATQLLAERTARPLNPPNLVGDVNR